MRDTNGRTTDWEPFKTTTLAILPLVLCLTSSSRWKNVSSVGTTPVTSYQVLWAAPWIQHRGAAETVAVTSPEPQTPGSGKQLYAENCAACHGANGEGSVGPNLHGIATKKSLDATIAFIEHPPEGIMPKLYPSPLSAAQVQEVSAYIRDTFR